MGETKIEWTKRIVDDGSGVKKNIPGYTMNPWIGCTKVSPACRNCYAEEFANRYGMARWGPNGTRSITGAGNWQKPRRWAKEAVQAGNRPLVFCASLADIAEDWQGVMVDSHGNLMASKAVDIFSHISTLESIPWDGSLAKLDGIKKELKKADKLLITMEDIVFKLARLIADTAPGLDWLLLTKRPERLRSLWPTFARHWYEQIHVHLSDKRPADKYRSMTADHYVPAARFYDGGGMIPNIWIGTTIEEHKYVDRAVELVNIPAVRRFVSAEPLVNPLNIHWLLGPPPVFNTVGNITAGDSRSINWLITGGESGTAAKPSKTSWFQELREQAFNAGVPFYFKQWGENAPACQVSGEDEHTASRFISLPIMGEVQYKMGKHYTGNLLDGEYHREIPSSVL